MTKDDLAIEWARDELEYLWNDLVEAERLSCTDDYAKPSLGMLGIMERIKRATAIVGPLDWRRIPITWLQNGKYELWANYMGIEYTYLPEEKDQGTVRKPYKAAKADIKYPPENREWEGQSEWPKWATGKWVYSEN